MPGTSALPALVHWQDQEQPAQVHHLQVNAAVGVAWVDCHQICQDTQIELPGVLLTDSTTHFMETFSSCCI